MAPAPRSAVEPTTADRVAADRFADAATDPGWLSGPGRPVPAAAPLRGRRAPPRRRRRAAVRARVARLALHRRAGGRRPRGRTAHRAGHRGARRVLDDSEDDDPEDDDAPGWQPLSERHRTGDPDDAEGDQPLETDAHAFDLAGPPSVADHTGGLEVVGVDDHDDPDDHDDLDDHDELDDHLLGGGSGGGGRGRRGGRGGGSGRPRKRRRPVTVLLSLVVLAGVVAGVFFGGKALYTTINPVAEDYSGSGTGSVDIRVNDGDSLRAIAGTLVGADVIASTDPFEEAAKANPAATGIQPGVYTLHSQMSGQAALDLLLDPASRQLTKVTVPEGLTATQVLQRLSDQTGLPLADLQAAAADPAALGLPAYANGVLEGFLFPATYDIEPGQTPTRDPVPDGGRHRAGARLPPGARGRPALGDHRGQHGAGGGRLGRGHGQGRPGAGQPAGRRHAAAAGHHGELRQRQERPDHHQSEDRANPSPYNTYVHPGCRRARSATPARRPSARCCTPPRVTGASSWWSTPTPARPASRRPRRSTRRTCCCSSSGCRTTRAIESRSPGTGRHEGSCPRPARRSFPVPAAAPGGVRRAGAHRLELRGAGHRGRGPARAAGRARARVARVLGHDAVQAGGGRRWPTRSTPLPRLLGAANTLTRTDAGGWRADNTDVFGVGTALQAAGVEQVEHAAILGAGGTAAAAAVALASLGARQVDLVVRDPPGPSTCCACWRSWGSPRSCSGWSRDRRSAPRWWSARCRWTGSSLVRRSGLAAPGRRSSTCSTPGGPHRWPSGSKWPAASSISGLEVLFWQATAQVELMTGHPAPIAAMRAALGA